MEGYNMNSEILGSDTDSIDSKVLMFFGEGGTFKDLKNISNEAMEAIYSVAYNLYQNGKYGESEKVFRFLCFYDHFSSKYFLGFGACKQMLKQYDSAIETFSIASLLEPDDPRPLMYIGDCHMSKNDREKAKMSYETAIEFAGNDEKYKSDLARVKNMLENIK